MTETAAAGTASPDLESRIREFVEREKLRYQSLNLPGNIRTAGHDRSYLEDIIFDEPFEGRTLLDIGCYLGYFCLEAMKRGAASATGIDPNREVIRQARELASLLSLKPEYICGDFERHDWAGNRYDTVLCLNVLHHLFDPLHAMKTMMELARRRLIIEFKTLSLEDLRFGWFNPLLLLARNTSHIFMAQPKVGDDIAGRSYLFTPNAMRMLFEAHSLAFEPVKITRSPFKDRYLLDARKRNIGHLLVVSGPTSSGKSTFADRFLADHQLRTRLGIKEDGWILTKAGKAGGLPTGRVENAVLMYDLMRPYRQAIRTIERDIVLDLLKIADKVSFITLVTPVERLRAQISDKEVKRLIGKLGEKRQDELLSVYRQGNGSPVLRSFYEEWFAYRERYRHKTAHDVLVVNNGETYDTAPQKQWRAILDQHS